MLRMNPAASAAITEKYKYISAYSFVIGSFGPLLGPAPTSILRVDSAGSSSESDPLPPPPRLMKTTQSIMNKVPTKSLMESF